MARLSGGLTSERHPAPGRKPIEHRANLTRHGHFRRRSAGHPAAADQNRAPVSVEDLGEAGFARSRPKFFQQAVVHRFTTAPFMSERPAARRGVRQGARLDFRGFGKLFFRFALAPPDGPVCVCGRNGIA